MTEQLEKTERYWYAIYTRPRFERKVAEGIAEKGIRSFMPSRTVERIWSDRKKMIEEPLFPSYVFVYADAKERYLSLQTHGAVRMVSFDGRPSRIPEDQIAAIYKLVKYGFDPQPHQYLSYGDEVEVMSGSLKGVRGFFLEDRSGGRFIMSIHEIKQSLAIELHKRQVRKISLRNHDSN